MQKCQFCLKSFPKGGGKGSIKTHEAAHKAQLHPNRKKRLSKSKSKKPTKKGVTSEVAEKANAAGKKPEIIFSNKIKHQTNNVVLNGSGIPDIIAYNKNWEFYEVKPYKKNGKTAANKDRLLNPNQQKAFKEMSDKGIAVTMIYYYRTTLKQKDKHGHPLYNYKFKKVTLKKSDFKKRGIIDPKEFERNGRLAIA